LSSTTGYTATTAAASEPPTTAAAASELPTTTAAASEPPTTTAATSEAPAKTAAQLRAQAAAHGAHNYHPLPVVIGEAEGAWVTDVDGRRYLDMLAAYSAINFGHRHPRLVAAAQRQLDRVTLVSRAFEHDQFGPFCAELAALAGMDMVLPMNTGAEAVETAIKTARKWGYEVKGVPDREAVIIVFDGNFHGRTTTIISFSTDPDARSSFGPYTPGFHVAPYGDLDALAAAMSENVVAVLIEPIQGEAGVVVPPPGFLAGVRALCTARGALMIADEIQSGLGRTGTTFACEHDDVVPDMYVLGKALGGGIVPVSAVVSAADVLGVFKPGQHGSTFGGNPLACAVAREVIAMLSTGEYQERSAKLGAHMHDRLNALPQDKVSQVRGRGLWAGVEFTELPGRVACERLAERGVLAKDTHGSTIRLAPPLVISETDLDWGLDQLEALVR
jgi:ornithine--oxo-acid transaminase